MVTLTLDYCNVLYMGLPLKKTWKLHLVKNATAQLLLGAKQNPCITQFLLTLHGLPIGYWVHIQGSSGQLQIP